MDITNLEENLEQNEKIISIFSESLPQLNDVINGRIVTLSNIPVMRLFAKQMLALKDCNLKDHSHLFNRYPSLKLWLKVLNITQSSFNTIISSHLTFHDLFNRSNHELKEYLISKTMDNGTFYRNPNEEEDINVICASFESFKKFYSNMERGVTNAEPIQIPIFQIVKSTINSNTNIFFDDSILIQQRTNKQRKSESDVQVNGLNQGSSSTAVPKINENKSNNNASNNSTNLIVNQSISAYDTIYSPINNNPSSKAQALSPIPSIKPRKPGSQKVTTPPPLRKLSTGNLNGIINNPQIQATAKEVANALNSGSNSNLLNINNSNKYHEENSKINTNTYNENSKTNTSTTDLSNASIQRSSSHESHLRNKAPFSSTPQYLTTTSMSSNKNNPNNITRQSPSSTSNELNLLNDDVVQQQQLISDSLAYGKNDAYQRRLSTEGSDYSSKCPSGQASPNLQSPTRKDLFQPNKLKQFQEHRWTKTINISNTCGVCSKKMIFSGSKCKLCNFLKYIRLKNIKDCQICRKPLWHGVKCKNCKFRCHKECEKNCKQNCLKNNLFPFVGNNESTTNLQASTASSSTNQSPLIGHSPSHQVSHSSSTNVNNMNEDDSSQHQQPISWATGTSNKMARIANRIVDSITSISTPKQPHRQINTQETPVTSHQQKPFLTNLNDKPRNNVVESISSSSCNSSEPNSPNNLKPYNSSGVYYPNSMNPHNHIYAQPSNSRFENEKKSSTSSIASSVGTHASSSNSSSNKLLLPLTNQSGQFAQSSVYNSNNNLSPNPALYSTRSPSSATKPGEFFPLPTTTTTTTTTSTTTSTSTTATISSLLKTDINNNQSSALDTSAKNSFLNNSHLKHELNSNATDETHNTLTNDDSNLNPTLDDEFNSTKQTINDGDYDPNDVDLIQSSDFQQINITYEEITEKTEIGRGRFGIVYKAYWHGPIAIKEIDFDSNLNENSEQLKNFKEEVLNLKKTRHANLILFIGACMKPPKCAIVMSLCRGVSLYKYLHSDIYTKPNIEAIIDIATQIAQGMGYLHNKNLIHKDLRSKNVFIDGNKVVITDFGLYSITHLCNKSKRKDLLPITKECLYYMAPELVKLIGTDRMESAFSHASDVFSFGTIWYELFRFEYPFSSYSTDTVLYLIGSGLKNIYPNIQIPKEFKIILLKCWSNDPANRPDFSRLLETFRAIPKRTKLFRSPSHPVHIGRPFET